MENYTEKDVLRLAKRIRNSKRSYLLVDPLQGKHVPVSPTKTYQMSRALGDLLYEKAPEAGLIIGFAETATAIGAIASMSFPDDTIYLHTTREQIDSDRTVSFLEEHSHAVDQLVECSYIAENRTKTIIMIDDEISTGHTIENVVTRLRGTFPFLETVRFVIGSVINRMNPQVRKRMERKNIHFVSLVRVEERDYETTVRELQVSCPDDVKAAENTCYREYCSHTAIADLRRGVKVGELKRNAEQFSCEITNFLSEEAHDEKRLLILGTEECMTAAIMTGKYIEEHYQDLSVFSHSTTRSPIGICPEQDYPCKNGCQLFSFYEEERGTYLYNIDDYDMMIVITDSKNTDQTGKAMRQLSGIYQNHCKNIFLIRG